MRHRPFLALLTLLALIQWAWLFKAVPQLHGNDFGIFYRSAASAAPYAGHPGNPAMESGELLTNLNPPHFLVVIAPFTLLPLWLACGIWWLLTAGLLALGLTWWLAVQGERWTTERMVWAFLWAPTFCMGFTGQVTGLLGLPLWLAYRDLRGRRSFRGGLLAGLVLSIKPILWPLALWHVARGAWSVVVGMLAGAAAAVAVGLVLYGIDVYRAWIVALGRLPWASEVMNASLSGIGARLPFPTPPIVWLAAGLALVGWTVWRTRSRDLGDAWMPLVAVSLLASPLGWVYYGAWLLPGTRVRDWTQGAALGWCMPLLAIAGFGFTNSWYGATIGSCYGWTLLAIWYRAAHGDECMAASARRL